MANMREAEGFSVSFTPNADILLTLSSSRTGRQKVLGFAAETTASEAELMDLAKAKCARKQADVLAGRIQAMGVEALPCGSIPQAVQAAMDFAGRDGVACALGSLYMSGEIRDCFQ